VPNIDIFIAYLCFLPFEVPNDFRDCQKTGSGLLLIVKGLFKKLYLIMDVFSRKIVAWKVYAPMLATLQTLGVMLSFSRPSVSDENPYPEAMVR
jgi:hypothetical protein